MRAIPGVERGRREGMHEDDKRQMTNLEEPSLEEQQAVALEVKQLPGGERQVVA